MAGRFPGAKNIVEFWDNLKNGICSVSFFSDEELEQAGVAPAVISDPNYVKAGAILKDVEYFDAAFFGYTPREAEIMHPQMRIFHEVVWQALEDAGYDPGAYRGLIGLYAGAVTSFYWESLAHLSGKSTEFGEFAAWQLAFKDFLCTRVSFKLNLKGPSLLVQTACSTSLVSIHQACRALLTGECDIAMAGGITVSLPRESGYTYQQGMINSPDGFCRAFDAKAQGTVMGSGVGVVVLKLLKDAAADRDNIYAVIKGSAINNDGSRKVGYTAPSVEAQAEAIRKAQRMACVEPGSIGYIEAHGTGTTLGDPVEIEALKTAFNTDKRNFCAVGSVKTNVGHLDMAAGVSGFIKTVLALKYKLIPPTLHFEIPNPEINFENSPFYVNTKLKEWKNDGCPLRAGVSSLGIGGTNAHVVLEEWPPPLSTNQLPDSSTPRLILLSAKNQSALDRMTKNLAAYFKNNPGINLADAAYTLQLGRRAFGDRRMCVCSSVSQAVEALVSLDSSTVNTFCLQEEERDVTFMFSGQGAQYVNMGWELYQKESLFREEMERCFEILRPLVGLDLKEVLYPRRTNPGSPVGAQDEGEIKKLRTLEVEKDCHRRLLNSYQPFHSSFITQHSHPINMTGITQPVIFTFEYALAKLLMKWGIKPYAMIGHSIGEYAAACLAGVFSLEDALKLVASRGQLMQEMPPGSMLSVSLPRDSLRPLLSEELSTAAVNTPSRCVVSGPKKAIDELSEKLTRKGIENRRLHTSHAFHSKMMDPVIEPFLEVVKQVTFNKPGIPYISNVTGKWITDAEAVHPGYWAKHLRETVRFSDGLRELLKNDRAVFVEIGPGKTLSTFVRQHAEKKPGQFVVNLVRHPGENVNDENYLLKKIGQLWLYGIHIDWCGFNAAEERQRIGLPAYSFDRQRYWIDGNPFKMGSEVFSANDKSLLEKKKDIADWFYIPSWKRCTLAVPEKKVKGKPIFNDCLVFIGDCGLGTLLVEQLRDKGKNMIVVKAGKIFGRQDESLYTINPGNDSDYDSLFKDLQMSNGLPDLIIHLWSLTGNGKEVGGSKGKVKENDKDKKKEKEKEKYKYKYKDKDKDNAREDDKEINMSGPEEISDALNRGFYSQLYIARAIRKHSPINDLKILVVSNNIQEVTGAEVLCPGKAAVLGPVKVIPQELPNVVCRSIDVVLPRLGTWQEKKLVDQLVMEVSTESADTDKIAAYRNHHRLVQTFEPVRLNEEVAAKPVLRERGVYLITGGLGNIGMMLAKFLAASVQAGLVLTGRSSFPERSGWEEWLSIHDKQDSISLKIRKLMEIERLGGQIMVCSANVADPVRMKEVIRRAQEQFGQINGVIHAAGVLDGESGYRPVDQVTKSECEKLFHPKIYGLLELEKLFKDKKLDFCLLMSSLSTVLGGLGFAAYAAANLFMDAFVQARSFNDSSRWISVNWDAWIPADMENSGSIERVDAHESILPEEGEKAFQRILSWQGENQVVVSVKDLRPRIDRWIKLEGLREDKESKEREPDTSALKTRPNVTTPYVPPRNQLERAITAIWQKQFGFENLGINDDFFELGGDSLKMMTVVSKIHRELDVDIPLNEFFDNPTIERLAEYMKRSGKSRGFIQLKSVEKKAFYPLSSAQSRLYVVQQMDESSSGYNLTQAVLLDGNIKRENLEEVCRKLIRRHEALRTSICLVENEAVQRIHDEVEFAVEYHEASEDQAKTILRRFVRPFDLSTPPFFRVGLIKLAGEKYILVLDIHHLITDGASTAIFFNNLISFFRGKELSPLRFQYKDYTEWQNSEEIQEDLKSQEAYWLKRFAGEIPVLNMPTDFPRLEKRVYQGDVTYCTLEKELTKKIDGLMKETGTTVYMVLLSVFTILLSKYSQQEDIIVGSPIIGRRHSDLQDMIGVFVNMLAMRNRPCGDKTYRQFLLEVKKNVLEAYENQDYPFDKLAMKVGRQGNLNRNPLFDTVFQLNPDNLDENLDGSRDNYLKITPYQLEEKRFVFDMVLIAVETGEGIRLRFGYSTSLFKRSRCEKMIKRYVEIINQVVDNDSIKLKDIHISHELLRVKPKTFRDDQSDFGF